MKIGGAFAGHIVLSVECRIVVVGNMYDEVSKKGSKAHDATVCGTGRLHLGRCGSKSTDLRHASSWALRDVFVNFSRDVKLNIENSK